MTDEEIIAKLPEHCREPIKDCLAGHRLNADAIVELAPELSKNHQSKLVGVSTATIGRARKRNRQGVSVDTPTRERDGASVKQRQVSVDVDDEAWAFFKEGAREDGISAAAKLGQLIEYHAPSRENEEADSWACIPNAMKEAQLNKQQQQSMKSVLKHFKDRRSQRLLILALEAEWPWMPQLS